MSFPSIAMHPTDHFLPEWNPAGPGAAPQAEDIHVWRIPIGEQQPAALAESQRAQLDPDETERAARFHFERDRRRFILSRGALRSILGRCLEIDPAEVAFEYGRHGKPEIAPGLHGVSAAPGLQFNVSHAGDFALIAVGREHRLGIDLERVRPMKDADAVARRFFSPAECLEYESFPAAGRPAAFFRCWTRKEAFIKAIGEGLSRPLHAFDVTLAPGAPPRLLRVDGHPGEEKRWALYSFEPAPGYFAALIVERPENTLRFYELGAAI